MAIWAPSRAMATATARPMPLSPPVMSATLPLSLPTPGYFGVYSGRGCISRSRPGWRSCVWAGIAMELLHETKLTQGERRRRQAVPDSGEFQDHRIDRQAVAGLGIDLFDGAVDLGAQHVFHLHGLDHGDGLAGFDLLADRDRDRDDQARHRTQHLLAAVGLFLRRHQARERGFRLGVDIGLGLDAPIGQRETVERRA